MQDVSHERSSRLSGPRAPVPAQGVQAASPEAEVRLRDRLVRRQNDDGGGGAGGVGGRSGRGIARRRRK